MEKGTCSTSGLVFFGKVRHLSSAQGREMLLHHNSNCWCSSVLGARLRPALGRASRPRPHSGEGPPWARHWWKSSMRLVESMHSLDIEMKKEQTFCSSVLADRGKVLFEKRPLCKDFSLMCPQTRKRATYRSKRLMTLLLDYFPLKCSSAQIKASI